MNAKQTEIYQDIETAVRAEWSYHDADPLDVVTISDWVPIDSDNYHHQCGDMYVTDNVCSAVYRHNGRGYYCVWSSA